MLALLQMRIVKNVPFLDPVTRDIFDDTLDTFSFLLTVLLLVVLVNNFCTDDELASLFGVCPSIETITAIIGSVGSCIAK